MTDTNGAPAQPEEGTPNVPAVVDPRMATLAELAENANDAQTRMMAFQAATAIQRSKLIRGAAIQIANEQWGATLSESARVAVARWAYEVGLDPVRHIEILGGKIYDKAELYMDKLASMDTFSHVEVELVAPLDRRDLANMPGLSSKDRNELMREQSKLNTRRTMLQMKHAVPVVINEHPETAAAAVVTLHFRDGTEAVGVNWAGSMGRKYKTSGKPLDPVGDQHPVKTAITRAYRKAAKQKVPLWFKHEAGEDSPLAHVETVIEQGRQAAKALPSDRGKTMRVPLDGEHELEIAPPGPIPVASRESLVDPEKTYGDDLTEDQVAELEAAADAATAAHRQRIDELFKKQTGFTREEWRDHVEQSRAKPAEEVVDAPAKTDEDRRVQQEDLEMTGD